jgi:hypothetical protein
MAMTEALSLDLTETEAVVLDLHDGQPMALSLTETVVALQVVGQVGPRGPQGEVGPEGPEGPEGPIGPIGPQGGFYRHSQAAPAAIWLIPHNLGYPPAVTTVDSANTAMFGDVTYIDDNNVQVEFGVAIGGYAYCS